jgi:L-arabinokinase
MALPESIRGDEFAARYGDHGDAATRIDPERTYAVRVPTSHPVEENARVQRFRELLQQPPGPALLQELGDLMFGSHRSYSACGLGNEVTDFLVEQVERRRACGAGVYGAKITGGGSGGTVAILGERGLHHTVGQIAELYAGESGRTSETAVYAGSSDGSRAFGVRELAPPGHRAGG